ncbi:hypothetical protein [Flavobacterium sp.]|uniref:beta strand repeat-containing protein n=1 Tax=Flavobacterium sp. TaxID=239 RepID=UPI00286C8B78|nr:hypothetical protein [Flavobacterium sp.]
MKKNVLNLIIIVSFFLIGNKIYAQVGIGTTMPFAQLDIRSSNQATPTNTDGILIPKVDTFPSTNPGLDQQSMLVYLTTATTFGGNPKAIGFYYWDDNSSDWIGISSAANGDHDWYEEGTTTAPNAITDDMFHSGNVAIGKITADFPLEVNTTNFDTGINSIYTSSTTNTVTKTGIDNAVSGTSNDIHNGIRNTISSSGSGNQYGSRNNMTGTGSGLHIGTFNDLLNGTGIFWGTYNRLNTITSAFHYGTFNDISGGDGSKSGTRNLMSGTNTILDKGIENLMNGTGTAMQMGTYNTIGNNGDGIHYGVYNDLNNVGNGDQYGNYTALTNTGAGIHYGNYNILSGNGTASGNQYGTVNAISKIGNSDHYGTENILSGTGNGNQYGSYSLISNSGIGLQYGAYHVLSGNGFNGHYGVYNLLSGSSGGVQTGTLNEITNTAGSSHYGASSVLSGSGAATKYGFNAYIDPTAGGTHYGVYSSTLKPGATNFAGYFLGNVGIGTAVANTYTLPPSRGLVGQTMRTDGAGNVTWANNSDFAWSLTGNSGTVPGTNFIGTTDAFDFRIKTGNTNRWNISNANAGQLQSFSLGTALLPIYSFQTDTNTGMFSSAADILAFATNGVQRMTIGSTGNVGIGTTAPGFTLDVASAGRTINTTTSVGTSAAVFGFNTTASGAGAGGYGVGGQTAQSGSAGVRGEQLNAGGDAISAINFGVTGAGAGSGIYAQTAQSGGTGIDAININTSGTAIYSAGQNVGGTYLIAGSGGSFNGVTTGVHARSTTVGVGEALYSDQFGNITRVNYWSGATQYKIIGTGTVSTTAENINGERVTLHCTEAPEIYFEDYGQGQLVNGSVHIEIDPTIAKNITVNDKHPLRVYIQLEDNCNGVYVTNKTGNSFDVKELANGQSNAKFQYHIVGNRADELLPNGRISKNADTRFELAPKNLETKEAAAVNVGKPTSAK